MRKAVVPLVGFLGLAALGCGTVQFARALAQAGQAAPDAAGAVHTVYYRAGEGFVPARVDLETGDRVVLVNESGEPLTPLFAGRHDHGHSGGATDADADHGAHNDHNDHAPTTDPGVPAWEARPGESGSGRWEHSFDVSGYWRFHNELNPDHAGLVVALSGSDAQLEPLVMEHHEHSFPDPPQPTVQEYAEILQDREALRKYMVTYGPENALEALRRAKIQTGMDCHHSAHHLGRMAFAEYGPPASAAVADACQSGMRHGLIEQLFVTRGIANLAEDVDSICPPEGQAFSRYQCLHGVGHGVMAWTAYELEDALELCELLDDDWSQRSCYTGVFMENVAGGLSASGRSSPYVDREDPHYPCNSLPERHVDDCYWYQTSQMLRVFNHDLTRGARACAEAPPAGRRACFGSYGRDVSGIYRTSPHRIVQFCDEAPSSLFRGDCIDGAARTLFWDATQQGIGLMLCETVEDRVIADTCYESILLQAHSVLPRAELEPFCRQVPDHWQDRCRQPLASP